MRGGVTFRLAPPLFRKNSMTSRRAHGWLWSLLLLASCGSDASGDAPATKGEGDASVGTNRVDPEAICSWLAEQPEATTPEQDCTLYAASVTNTPEACEESKRTCMDAVSTSDAAPDAVPCTDELGRELDGCSASSDQIQNCRGAELATFAEFVAGISCDDAGNVRSIRAKIDARPAECRALYKACPELDPRSGGDQDFVCFDGTYILNGYVCDGFQDCAHGEDELSCDVDAGYPDGSAVSPDGGLPPFPCASGVYVPGEYQCDGVPDCEGGDDEQNCPAMGNDGGFICNDGTDIADSWLCDRYLDCKDGEDEANCSDGGFTGPTDGGITYGDAGTPEPTDGGPDDSGLN
jgi:hypothetical protein